MWGYLFGAVTVIGVIRQVMLWAGVAVLTFGGIDVIVDGLVDGIQTAYDGLPSDTLDYMQLSGIPFAVKKVLSAHATVLSVQVFKRLGFKA